MFHDEPDESLIDNKSHTAPDPTLKDKIEQAIVDNLDFMFLFLSEEYCMLRWSKGDII